MVRSETTDPTPGQAARAPLRTLTVSSFNQSKVSWWLAASTPHASPRPSDGITTSGSPPARSPNSSRCSAATAHWSIVAGLGTALGCLELFGRGATAVALAIGGVTIASPLMAFHAYQNSRYQAFQAPLPGAPEGN
jgi:hypothetical protein